MTFFPECGDVCHAIGGRPLGDLWDDEQFKLMTSHHNSVINSWSLDETSNGNGQDSSLVRIREHVDEERQGDHQGDGEVGDHGELS